MQAITNKHKAKMEKYSSKLPARLWEKGHSRLFFIVISFLLSVLVFDSEAQPWLKKAEDMYDDGQVEKIPDITKRKVKKDIARDQELQARRLTILSHIYNDQWRAADSSMLSFLEFENEYQLLREDSATEFQYLYNSYRTTPVFALGVVGGGNFTYVRPTNIYGTYNLNNSKGDYSPKSVNFQFGFQFTLYLDFIIDGLSAAIELQYFRNKYQYSNQLFDFTKLNIEETQSWLRVPLYFSYALGFKKKNLYYSSNLWSKIRPFAIAGISPAMMINSNCQAIRTYTDDSHNDIKGSDISLKELRSRINLWGMVGAGVKYKVKMGYVFCDLRFYYGIFNHVAKDNRYSNNELIYNYYYIDNDFKTNFALISFGYKRLIYIPRKLKNKGYNYFD